MAELRVCIVEGCGKKRYGHGLCLLHWKRWKRHGDPLGGLTRKGEPREFIETVVLPYAGDECLRWPYALSETGYGLFRCEGAANKTVVSRYVCIRIHGPAPTPKHEAAHSCGKGHLGCVNPRHLSWKTRVGNQADRVIHGTSNRGENNHFAKLTADDVGTIRSMAKTMPIALIAQLFGVSYENTRTIIRGNTWRHIE